MSISISVYRPSDGRPFYLMQWTDPVTGRKVTRTTKKTTESEARIVAGRKLAELERGDVANTKMAWTAFRKLYMEQVAAPFKLKARQTVQSAFNAIEMHINPRMVASLTAVVISDFATKLRATGLTESSVKRHLSNVRAMLRWAARLKIIREAPHISMPRKVARMKGRAPTQEEFERIIAKIPEVVGETRAESWQFFIEGLWWSSLRLQEAMDLHWTDDRLIAVDFTGKHPRFRIQVEGEKGNTARLLSMAPEFAQMLQAVPMAERRGFVFNPLPSDDGPRLEAEWAGRVITKIGQLANVKVAIRKSRGKRGRRKGEADIPKGTEVAKFASAHDFRRAFGLRWAARVMPNVLAELMRHESIETTQTYYVGRNSDATGDIIWDVFANNPANTPAEQSPAEHENA